MFYRSIKLQFVCVGLSGGIHCAETHLVVHQNKRLHPEILQAIQNFGKCNKWHYPLPTSTYPQYSKLPGIFLILCAIPNVTKPWQKRRKQFCYFTNFRRTTPVVIWRLRISNSKVTHLTIMPLALLCGNKDGMSETLKIETPSAT